jgi:hypothetical protein
MPHIPCHPNGLEPRNKRGLKHTLDGPTVPMSIKRTASQGTVSSLWYRVKHFGFWETNQMFSERGMYSLSSWSWQAVIFRVYSECTLCMYNYSVIPSWLQPTGWHRAYSECETSLYSMLPRARVFIVGMYACKLLCDSIWRERTVSAHILCDTHLMRVYSKCSCTLWYLSDESVQWLHMHSVIPIW